MISTILGVIQGVLGDWLGEVIVAVTGFVTMIFYGRSQRKRGKAEVENAVRQKTLEQVRKGQTVSRGAGSPDERVRRLDGDWDDPGR
jgi:preprotein translocase subunit YajC